MDSTLLADPGSLIMSNYCAEWTMTPKSEVKHNLTVTLH